MRVYSIIITIIVITSLIIASYKATDKTEKIGMLIGVLIYLPILIYLFNL